MEKLFLLNSQFNLPAIYKTSYKVPFKNQLYLSRHFMCFFPIVKTRTSSDTVQLTFISLSLIELVLIPNTNKESFDKLTVNGNVIDFFRLNRVKTRDKLVSSYVVYIATIAWHQLAAGVHR